MLASSSRKTYWPAPPAHLRQNVYTRASVARPQGGGGRAGADIAGDSVWEHFGAGFEDGRPQVTDFLERETGFESVFGSHSILVPLLAHLVGSGSSG